MSELAARDGPVASAMRTPERGVILGSLAAASVGLALLLLGLHVDADRVWFSYLDEWTFGTTVCVGALLLLMTGHVAKAGWMVVTRRLTEATASALPLYLVLFAPLALGLSRVYPWAAAQRAGSPSLRRAIEHTHSYLNAPFFILRTVLYFAVFIAVAALLSRWSQTNDRYPRLALVKRMRRLSGGALPLVGIALTWAGFDWTMSLEPDWSSTIFGMYYFAGSFVGAIALVAAVLGLSARRAGLSEVITADHAQATGRVLFAMIIFWAYMAFSQLLIYWIGDLPDEIEYYRLRTTGSWNAVTYSLVFGNFFIPFFALLGRQPKRRLAYLGWVAAWVFFMHFVDVYWMIMPVHDGAGVRPHWLDLAAALFVGGLSCAWIVHRYSAAPALPSNVPELADGLDYEAAV